MLFYFWLHKAFKSDVGSYRKEAVRQRRSLEERRKVENEPCGCIPDRLQRSNGAQRQDCQESGNDKGCDKHPFGPECGQKRTNSSDAEKKKCTLACEIDLLPPNCMMLGM